MDTILNYNETENSQILPDLWRDKISESVFDEIKSDKLRGNYISLVSREGPEKELADLIEKHWKKLSSDEDYKTMVNINPDK